MFDVESITARRILSPVSGFLAEAGFSHSLTPARNCTFGCLYCYVPTMRVQAGLAREDWERWGQRTAFKQNAAALLSRELKPGQSIYCSPLTDPYQPAEESARQMPGILSALALRPPAVFVIQTRGPLIVRDRDLLAAIPGARVSFSLTTADEQVRRRLEPHCPPLSARIEAMRELRAAGVRVFATLAPLLPGDVEDLARQAIAATNEDLVGDPLHVRLVKPRGATTRATALPILERHGWSGWLDPGFQAEQVERVRSVAAQAGRRFLTGPEGFALLSK